MSRAKMLILEVILLLSLVLEAAVVAGDRRTVYIANDMQPGEKLKVHCKSGDKDIGVMEVEYGQVYKFQFNVNIWGTTLYYCYVFWKDKGVSFDAYRHSRDAKKCFVCNWSFSLDGAYWWDVQQRQWILMFPW
ncbi:hypothetical protein SLE2022_241330 [Rubroshorea leprosula]|uniref:S-protein homolog n=1 Tax=Rubroshorea leprosula TaxID=152421 RepID=A0AAV5KFE9_9ROSI|nr:hypothetical protein SLEP1_g33062 [Rubroshorea leprosula]